MSEQNKFLEAFELVEGTWKTSVTGFILESLKKACLQSEVEGNIDIIDTVKRELIESEELPFNQSMAKEDIENGLEFIWHMEKLLP